MKTSIITLFVALIFFNSISDRLQAGELTFLKYTPGKPAVDDTVRFTHPGANSGCIYWDFGDGTPGKSVYGSSATHTYRKQGTFSVNAWDRECDWSLGDMPTARTKITIRVKEKKKRGTIASSPQLLHEGERVTMTGRGFKSTCITWDFGDGNRKKGKLSTKHTYIRPGSYTVKMFADCGKELSGSKKITVKKVNRSLGAAKKRVEVGESVVFKTRGFLSDCIRWDFGDRQTINRGKTQETHAFKKAGAFTVKAYDQCGANGIKAESIHVKVLDQGLRITDVILKVNGSHKVAEVALKDPLPSQAVIRYKGKGTLTYQWLFDHRPIGGTHKQQLINGGKITLKAPSQLLTNQPGTHTLSLKILGYKKKVNIPVLSYLVSPTSKVSKNLPLTPRNDGSASPEEKAAAEQLKKLLGSMAKAMKKTGLESASQEEKEILEQLEKLLQNNGMAKAMAGMSLETASKAEKEIAEQLKRLLQSDSMAKAKKKSSLDPSSQEEKEILAQLKKLLQSDNMAKAIAKTQIEQGKIGALPQTSRNTDTLAKMKDPTRKETLPGRNDDSGKGSVAFTPSSKKIPLTKQSPHYGKMSKLGQKSDGPTVNNEGSPPKEPLPKMKDPTRKETFPGRNGDAGNGSVAFNPPSKKKLLLKTDDKENLFVGGKKKEDNNLRSSSESAIILSMQDRDNLIKPGALPENGQDDKTIADNVQDPDDISLAEDEQPRMNPQNSGAFIKSYDEYPKQERIDNDVVAKSLANQKKKIPLTKQSPNYDKMSKSGQKGKGDGPAVNNEGSPKKEPYKRTEESKKLGKTQQANTGTQQSGKTTYNPSPSNNKSDSKSKEQIKKFLKDLKGKVVISNGKSSDAAGKNGDSSQKEPYKRTEESKKLGKTQQANTGTPQSGKTTYNPSPSNNKSDSKSKEQIKKFLKDLEGKVVISNGKSSDAAGKNGDSSQKEPYKRTEESKKLGKTQQANTGTQQSGLTTYAPPPSDNGNGSTDKSDLKSKEQIEKFLKDLKGKVVISNGNSNGPKKRKIPDHLAAKKPITRNSAKTGVDNAETQQKNCQKSSWGCKVPNLEISKIDPGKIKTGDKVTVTVTVGNASSAILYVTDLMTGKERDVWKWEQTGAATWMYDQKASFVIYNTSEIRLVAKNPNGEDQTTRKITVGGKKVNGTEQAFLENNAGHPSLNLSGLKEKEDPLPLGSRNQEDSNRFISAIDGSAFSTPKKKLFFTKNEDCIREVDYYDCGNPIPEIHPINVDGDTTNVLNGKYGNPIGKPANFLARFTYAQKVNITIRPNGAALESEVIYLEFTEKDFHSYNLVHRRRMEVPFSWVIRHPKYHVTVLVSNPFGRAEKSWVIDVKGAHFTPTVSNVSWKQSGQTIAQADPGEAANLYVQTRFADEIELELTATPASAKGSVFKKTTSTKLSLKSSTNRDFSKVMNWPAIPVILKSAPEYTLSVSIIAKKDGKVAENTIKPFYNLKVAKQFVSYPKVMDAVLKHPGGKIYSSGADILANTWLVLDVVVMQADTIEVIASDGTPIAQPITSLDSSSIVKRSFGHNLKATYKINDFNVIAKRTENGKTVKVSKPMQFNISRRVELNVPVVWDTSSKDTPKGDIGIKCSLGGGTFGKPQIINLNGRAKGQKTLIFDLSQQVRKGIKVPSSWKCVCDTIPNNQKSHGEASGTFPGRTAESWPDSPLRISAPKFKILTAY